MNAQLVHPAINNLNQTERNKFVPPWVLVVSIGFVIWCIIASLLWLPFLEHLMAFSLFRSIIGMIAVAVAEVLKYYLSEQIAAVLMEVISNFFLSCYDLFFLKRIFRW